MSFSNPWDNANNPIRAIQNRRRKKAKAAAKAAGASTAPSPDHRDQEVADNQSYASRTASTAQAQQTYFGKMVEPWAEFLEPSPAPKSKWPMVKNIGGW